MLRLRNRRFLQQQNIGKGKFWLNWRNCNVKCQVVFGSARLLKRTIKKISAERKYPYIFTTNLFSQSALSKFLLLLFRNFLLFSGGKAFFVFFQFFSLLFSRYHTLKLNKKIYKKIRFTINKKHKNTIFFFKSTKSDQI